VVLRLTLSTDGGAEITSLVSPVRDVDYFVLSDAELSEQFIEPYLTGLRSDALMLLGYRTQAVEALQGAHGPA